MYESFAGHINTKFIESNNIFIESNNIFIVKMKLKKLPLNPIKFSIFPFENIAHRGYTMTSCNHLPFISSLIERLPSQLGL